MARINALVSSAIVLTALLAVRADVQPGVWADDFTAAKAAAEDRQMPLVLVWSKGSTCPFCVRMETALAETRFGEWMTESGYLFCRVTGTSTKDAKAAYAFAATTGGFPYVSLYWPQGLATDKTNFCGRLAKYVGFSSSSEKTVKAAAESQSLADLQNLVMERAEAAFAGWGAYAGGSFVVGDTAYDRLEAEPDTESVWVPLTRTGYASRQAATNLLVSSSGGSSVTDVVVWVAGQTAAYVPVKTKSRHVVGGTVALTLLDDALETAGVGNIHCVAACGNAANNPYWVGERTVDTLGFADWTLDYDTARAKVAAGKADYLLVFYSGVQWCPYCKGVEESLMATSAWKAWLETNRVQLCLFDQDLSPTDAYAGGAGLLTYRAGEEHYNASGSRAMVSGAGYLSRHGLRDDDPTVVAVHERSITNSWSAWKAPGSTATRLSTPAVLLIGRDGRVLGRLNAWRDRNGVFGTDQKYYDTDENLARLDALLRLAGRADESDDYAVTSRLVHPVGEDTNVVLQVNSAARYLRLANLETGTLAVEADDECVKLAVTQGSTTLASGMGGISLKLNRSLAAATNLMLCVSVPSFTDTAANGLFGTDNERTVFLTSSIDPAVIVDTARFDQNFLGTNVLEEVVAEEGLTRVTVAKKSGTLPTGVSLKYDATLGAVVLVGTPSKVQTTTFSYQVTCYYGRVAVAGEIAEVTVTVSDPQERNPYVNQKLSRVLPLFADRDGTNLLVGTLTVSATAKNRLTVRFAGDAGKTLSFSGTWSAPGDDDAVSAHLAIRKQPTVLDLTLDAQGRLAASLADIPADYSSHAALTGASSAPIDYASYAGTYAVSLPMASADTEGLMSGGGYLLLTMTAAAAVRDGKVTVSGMLPNGTAASCTGYLLPDPAADGYALLPVFKRTATDTLALVLRIRENASALFRESETVRTVLAQPGTVQQWTHAEKLWGQTAELNVYGGYFPKGTKLGTWFGLFDYKPEVRVSLSSEGLVASGRYGALAEEQASGIATTNRTGGIVLVEKTGTLSIGYNAQTGLVSGSTKIVFESGKTVSASYRGVVTPGWTDCGCGEALVVRPFGYGTVYFTDVVDGVSLKRSLPIVLEVSSAE